MKLQVRIIEPCNCTTKEDKAEEIAKALEDLEDYQIKFITEHNGVYTVFYSKGSDSGDSDLLYYSRRDRLNKEHKHTTGDLFDASKNSKEIEFTKTTDLFKSPYTGPLNLKAFHENNKDIPITMSIENRKIKSVHINGNPVNYSIDDNGNITLNQNYINIIKDDIDYKRDNML